ncbi:hypothetical protein O1611_g3453 [Lasiodiplodia mahajangana]|uniref:Uncharacterized protein n=1 Tax=Lasiodiplodia mahajangana TaxID=1108764 RepID=A0ACC2JSK1_9PEZI|nr:hypothetical protein O1611_g3453 [Lasiodiplodia mahajangana]
MPVYVKSVGLPLRPVTLDVGLDAAGIVALADITTVQQRTALAGTAVLLDALVLCPGIHMQQQAPKLNHGEYPACAALTSGYVFRIENSATVYYLQQVGRTGHLTTLTVSRPIPGEGRFLAAVFPYHNMTPTSSLTYGLIILLTITIIILIGLSEDWWGISVVALLILSRLCNIVVIRRRSEPGWAGAPEPGQQGDLLVLLSQDRWIRIQGGVDDLKLVTSGQWLRDQTRTESWATALATVVVYLDAALVSNLTQLSKILLLVLLIASVGLLAIANSATKDLQMHGRIVSVVGPRKPYQRRLHLANELIAETGRDDWAVRLGMIVKNGCQCNDAMRATM